MERLRVGPDGVARCWWCGDDPLYVRYHDAEWGHKVTTDTRLFEKVCLEGFQSGLAWITILRKRDNFRTAFAGFDIDAVAAFGSADVERLVADTGIVRHRGKIDSVINNAARARELREEFGSLHTFFAQFRPEAHERPTLTSEFRVTTPESVSLSKTLKKRGWSYVGPTTMYALMQACGLVDDHIVGCERGV